MLDHCLYYQKPVDSNNANYDYDTVVFNLFISRSNEKIYLSPTKLFNLNFHPLEVVSR